MSTNVYEDIFTQVFAHRVAMKLPLPAGWQQEVIAQMCKRAPKGWCVGGPPEPARTPLSREDRQMSFEIASHTRVSKDLTPVSYTAYEAKRLAVCQTCNRFKGEHGIGLIGCGACGCTHLKAWAEETKCPLDKWIGEETQIIELQPKSEMNAVFERSPDIAEASALMMEASLKSPVQTQPPKKTRSIKLKPKKSAAAVAETNQ